MTVSMFEFGPEERHMQECRNKVESMSLNDIERDYELTGDDESVIRERAASLMYDCECEYGVAGGQQ